ncbi:MAG: shikimate kinase [bacterium]|nr:shikimate kinase [bacterium]
MIFLIGFSGSGKSTIGPKLAKRLRLDFFDTDQLIEKRCKKSIPRIFDEDGEKFFRQLESEVIESLSRKRKAAVVALGGGAFQSRNNRAVVADIGVSIYLSCSVRELYRRLSHATDRPLITGRGRAAKIKLLLNTRTANYRKADLSCSTSERSVAESVTRIIKLLKGFNASS